MKEKIEIVNRILTEWDPIGVGKDLAIDEYKGYIPIILQFDSDKNKLINYLKDILINEMGLDYSPYNTKETNALQDVCDRIIRECSVSYSKRS